MPPTPTPASHFHTLIYPGTPSSPPQTKSSPASHLPQDDRTIVSAGLSTKIKDADWRCTSRGTAAKA
ncbi:hypothetical protein ACO22_08039 [Paracoccidioides brasiliensis]|uniref:Uncharacterized protein n=1 Tax=Paracoccidioides brasiliensis TaxID=121759 RepID=A0A1D2J2Y5_PARBR|nr:hypothetical protein ACO22_08039 [Paracoccidioides brasiliensis]